MKAIPKLLINTKVRNKLRKDRKNKRGNPEYLKTVTIRINLDTCRKIEKICQDNRISMSSFCRLCINDKIKEVSESKTNTTSAVAQVFQTYNYSIFKSVNGNRNLNKLHLKRLKASIEKNYLFSPILVNFKYEIIDGQHRFEAAKELNLPIYYTMVKDYGLKEVQILNITSKKWNADDYLSGYIDMKLKDYIIYKQYKERYQFGHNECMQLLSMESGNGNLIQKFYEGKFKILNLSKANKIGDFILKILPFYGGAKRRSFIRAVIQIWDNNNFDPKYFISQAGKHRSMLYDCPNTSSYLDMIECIYNYRKRVKINLRF
jgi:hypothetical protein